MISDIKYALRLLRKDFGVAAFILLTLALCIGATTAIFSMIYALLVKPLPFGEPARIVSIYNTFPKVGLPKMPSSPAQYLDYKANTKSFESVGLWGSMTAIVGDEGASERLAGANCTAEMFDVLKVRPLIGRFFTLENDRQGADNVIVLTQDYWESRFKSDPGVLGRKLRVDGGSCEIIGVAPHSIGALDARVRFIRPYFWDARAAQPIARFSLSMSLYARLKPGVPVSDALGEAMNLERVYSDAAPSGIKQMLGRAGYKIAVEPLQAEHTDQYRLQLYLLQGGVIFVLLIGCLNVANLLLAKANGRLSEMAIRTALGAGRMAIARQMLIESLLLTLAGSAIGIGLAWSAVRVINRYSGRLLPQLLPFAIDGRVLGFAVALSIAVGLIIGLFPLVHVMRSNLAAAIHRTSRGASGGRSVRSLSSALIMGQVAVALVLLTGAGLLIRSFANALAVNPGLDPQNMVTSWLDLPASYRAQARSKTLQGQLLHSVREIPGVQDAALGDSIPFEGVKNVIALTLRDKSLPPNAPQPGAHMVSVSVGYFQAMGIQLLEGRFFNEADAAASRQLYVVDENFAKRYFPGRSAIGGNFTFGAAPAKAADWPEIIGVVRYVPHNGVEDQNNLPFVYYPLLRTSPSEVAIFVRSTRPVSDTVSALRETVRRLDPGIPMWETGTLNGAIETSFDNRRALMVLVGGFAGLALFLSAVGIYGVLAYDVSQRTREIGIRGAIGASPGQIVGLVMRQGLVRTGVGLGLGLIGAALLSRFMGDLLFEVKSSDPWTYAAVCALFAVVAALASYFPAQLAAKIDPIEALRAE
jgi:predicted permease